MTLQDIEVVGASEHNLRNVSVTIPRLQLTTITGVSGSGKSSLAFHTIYQEGQRRYVESLSAYARQFLGRMEKPAVERIDGLSPTLLIDQKTAGRNPRSTVGTITEIHDHFRLLFARLGTPQCPQCGAPVAGQPIEAIVDRIVRDHAGERIAVLAPVVRDRKGEYRKEMENFRLKGYSRIWIDGEEQRLDEGSIRLARTKRHTLELVVDRLRPDDAKRPRLTEAVTVAATMADGIVHLRLGADGTDVETFSTANSCPNGHGDFPELEPRLFSFNSPHGSCPSCEGLGTRRQPDESLVVGDATKSIKDGALKIMNRNGSLSYVRLGPRSLRSLAKAFSIDLEKPWKDLPAKSRKIMMHGSGKKEVTLEWDWSSKDARVSIKGSDTRPFEGILPALERHLDTPGFRGAEKFCTVKTCPDCEGTRLNDAARSVFFRDVVVTDLIERTVDDLHAWSGSLVLEGREEAIGSQLIKEITQRLRFLSDVGVGYLTLNRSARTLSGGEAQRVRLATQVGSGLQGVLYVLDEPSIGLHPRDNARLIKTLGALRDRGNTVLVVEHDEDTILASDVVIDIGPGAGVHGGEVLAAGPVDQVLAGPSTPTTDYLVGRRAIEVPQTRREVDAKYALTVVGATQHNLHNLTVAFPLGVLVAVTGVSGSGKSTLVDRILKRALAKELHGAEQPPGAHKRIDGLEHVDKVIEIDQQPIGRTPRSNPATYTGAMDQVRDIFSNTPESKVRGYSKGRFSFNVKGGRCEACEGAGVKTIEMQFLPDVQVMCEVCNGRRYNAETLEITYRDMAIDQILDMTVDEALEFFQNHKKLGRVLATLHDVGLGYVKLGQPSTTLSGGEAQRIKLASELARPATGRTLYILDEPTTGLHFEDVRVLLGALQSLVDAGNTILVVEHNLDVVKCADWVLDLGPEGGTGGGELVVAGTPETVAKTSSSHTGRALKPLLRKRLGAPTTAASKRLKKGKSKSKPARSADLVIKGATLHNLQSVDATIPHGKLTVVTGPSGSGKTSLAFDTIFAEGQRRYVESLSTYARRFLARMNRPPVESIHGLAPAIAIDQKTASRNPRSTVATSTEIHDYLRVLFARIGVPHCWTCGKQLMSWSPTAAAIDLVERGKGERAVITASLFSEEHEHPTLLSSPLALLDTLNELVRDGFVRVLLDGEEQRLDEASATKASLAELKAELVETSVIELVIDRIKVDGRRRTRLAESLLEAQKRGLGLAHVRLGSGAVLDYEARLGCARCDNWLPGDLAPRMFSFNSHHGACDHCEGLGRMMVASGDRLIDRPNRPLLDGAMTSRVGAFIARKHARHARTLESLADRFDVDIERPWSLQPDAFKRCVLRGTGLHADETIAVHITRESEGSVREVDHQVEWHGLLSAVEQWWRQTDSEGWWRRSLESLMQIDQCPVCRGGRLKPYSLATKIGAATIQDVVHMSVGDARIWFDKLKLSKHDATIAEGAFKELRNRLSFLDNVGLGYLTLDRASNTLSGGEAQRIRLASQLGNRLVGVLYVLDEPSIGLHPRDQAQLIATLEDLRDLGNTFVVVEHDRDTMVAADFILDLGPGAGRGGGKIVAHGTPAALKKNARSLTGRYLSGEASVPIPAERRSAKRFMTLKGARLHNLAGVTAQFPLETLTVVTGPSGSGKSSLVTGLLVPAMEARLEPGCEMPKEMKALTGGTTIDKLFVVDQSPIGRSPHSNPATYTGCFDEIRALFAGTPEAKIRGYGPGRFSTNVAEGRCDACQGRGIEIVEMHFLSDVQITCEVCKGRRYNRETLDVRYRGVTIADVLEMDVADARTLFENHNGLDRKLSLLVDVGLGYLKLGQSATTLSGGEAQRVKLAAELGRPGKGRSLVVLDEPTTGLHFDDIARLVAVLHRLVDQGNTVVVIEHNLDVIRAADHVLDLGPDGGRGGGKIVATGTPEEIAMNGASATAPFLRRAMQEGVTA